MRFEKSSPARIAVEEMLRNATAPLTSRQIMEATGVSSELVRVHLHHMMNRDEIHNLHPRSRKSEYVWGRGVKEEKPDIPAPRTFIPQGTYIPAAIHTREGSQDFLACCSRRGDELVPHTLPISMAGGAE